MKRWTMAFLALALTPLTVSAGASSFDGLGITQIRAEQDITDEHRALRSRLEEKYDIVPLTGGIALRPKTRLRDIRLIEISEGVVSINGVAVGAQELRERLDGDAKDILQLTYLGTAQRRELFGGPGAKAMPGRAEADEYRNQRSTGQRVRIFGDVVVNENERIGGEVVAVIGSVRVDGEVTREVVAVLGSVDLGPKAVVHGDVVSVGGRVRRAAGSQVRGGVTEVAFADAGIHFRPGPWFGPFEGMEAFEFEGFPRLLGSTFRMVLLGLLAGIVLVVARGSVERSTERVLDSPPKAVLVGLAAELLVVPVFLLTALVLLITVVGIPLLFLMPFAVLMLILFALVGFTGTAAAIGQAARHRFGLAGRAAFLDVCFGILIILSPLLIGRLLGVGTWPGNPFSWLLILTGTAFEFLAWTTGFGAVLINTFSRWRARRIARTAAPMTSA
jgi:hypothetical protein